ncbi:MAG: hypothetical protein M1833_006647 [Piccolia ochrophora]|nr:MAG: hypothetical protein M1833_006647 [Piccolia ochrophora]
MKLSDMDDTSSSPPLSRSSTPSSRGRRTPLSLDLSAVPPLVAPRPASNTLLITNLLDLTIFRLEHLQTIRNLINQNAPIHSWSPLKSFRRIVVSFYDIDSAIRVRQILDGEYTMGERIRVFFGEPTPIEPVDQHLRAPQSDKLFFISPPPSPPHGWEMRNEEPPNKEVYAEDLAAALAKLRSRNPDPPSPISPIDDMNIDERDPAVHRRRSGSATMIYHPEDHGHSPNLPAIAVEDLTVSPGDTSPLGEPRPATILHTSRPPVELMQD